VQVYKRELDREQQVRLIRLGWHFDQAEVLLSYLCMDELPTQEGPERGFPFVVEGPAEIEL
jgi:hypothetical protein